MDGHWFIEVLSNKQWENDHVFKRKFSALITAFDPRPGLAGQTLTRQQVRQTTVIG